MKRQHSQVMKPEKEFLKAEDEEQCLKVNTL